MENFKAGSFELGIKQMGKECVCQWGCDKQVQTLLLIALELAAIKYDFDEEHIAFPVHHSEKHLRKMTAAADCL